VEDRALVTGATGFIGRRLVRRLVGEGTSVRVLARSPDRVAPELRSHVEVVVGDLEQPDSLREATDGVDVVYHLAGLAAAWARRSDDFFVVNVDGVRELVDAAEQSGVRRIVHVSTVLTLFPSDGVEPTPYVASKREGERIIRQYVAAGGDAVIVHPCRVYGPGPLNDANGATRLLRSFLWGPLPVRLRDGGVRANWVHVDDVAEGLVLAARQGEPGESYVLGGENRSVEELLELAADVAGVRRRSLAVPPILALGIAGALELGGRLGAPVPITRTWVRSFLLDQAVDIGPTRAALGYHPRPLREGLTQTIEWLEHRNGDG
jgi:nucleoside-diphosphate-sugar epimerase